MNASQGLGVILHNCGAKPGGCGWTDLVALANVIITYLLYLSVMLAALSFAYAGWLYLTAGGDSGKVGKAHAIFWKVLMGFLIACMAWLIVSFITKSLGLNSNYSLLAQ